MANLTNIPRSAENRPVAASLRLGSNESEAALNTAILPKLPDSYSHSLRASDLDSTAEATPMPSLSFSSPASLEITNRGPNFPLNFPSALSTVAYFTHDANAVTFTALESKNPAFKIGALQFRLPQSDPVDKTFGYAVVADGPVQLRIGTTNGLFSAVDNNGQIVRCCLGDKNVGLVKANDVLLRQADARLVIPIDLRVGHELPLFTTNGGSKLSLTGEIGVTGHVGQVSGEVTAGVKVGKLALGRFKAPFEEGTTLAVQGGLYLKYESPSATGARRNIGVGFVRRGPDWLFLVAAQIPVGER